MYDKHFVGLNLTSAEDNGLQKPISRVTLFLDSENSITAGNDTGSELVADCPHATQEMVNAILAQVKGYQYQMFDAGDASLDPAAELGDGITAGGVYSVISRLDDDGSGYSSVAAPGKAELEDEYPTEGPLTQEFNRTSARLRSQIIKTATEITLRVDNDVEELNGRITLTASSLTAEINNTRDGLNSKIELTASSLTSQITDTKNGLESKIEQTESSLTAEINSTRDGLNSKIELTAESLMAQITNANGDISSLEQTVSSIKTRVSNAEGDISSLEQFADSLTLSVSNGSTSSTISLKAGSTTIKSQTIQMDGLVTFTGLSGGTTTINGACIQTGTIDAQYLNLAGAITFNDLSLGVRNNINDAYSMAEDAQYLANSVDDTVSGWTYGRTTYIDGAMIMTGTVMASRLLGGYVGLLDASEREVGGIYISGTSTGYGLEISTDYGGIRINPGGNFWVDAYYGAMGLTSSGLVCQADCVPLSGGVYDLGSSGLEWSDIYANNGEIITSDRNKKTDISYDLSLYERFFYLLKPVSYKLKNGSSGRKHVGLIAQDVESAMEEIGLSTNDFAGFIKSAKIDDQGVAVDGEYNYALRYGEFVSLCIQQIQKLSNRIAALERNMS